MARFVGRAGGAEYRTGLVGYLQQERSCIYIGAVAPRAILLGIEAKRGQERLIYVKIAQKSLILDRIGYLT